jgi:hypothetical protein
MDNNLRTKDIEEVLNKANTTPTTIGDLKGIMTIFVKCTLDIGERLKEASSEIKKFNGSTTRLNKLLVRLNGILTFATLVGVFAALKSAGLF